MLSPDLADRLVVVLVAPRNPLNIGAAARAMSNFGFLRLRLVAPYLDSFREARSAVGAMQVMEEAVVYATVGEAVADCTLVAGTTAVGPRVPDQPVYSLPGVADPVRARLEAGERVAILFGSEKRGLSNEDLSHCQAILRIPTREGHRSMNLGQAVAVCMYELARATGEAAVGMPEPAPAAGQEPSATAVEQERICELLEQSLGLSEYLGRGAAHRPAGPEAATDLERRRIRMLVRRLNLTSRDAATLTGMMRSLRWKLGEGAGEAREQKAQNEEQ